jgi:hypothetical protein
MNPVDLLGNISIIDIVNGGVYIYVFVAFMRGWILTRAHYEDIISQRDRWEAAYWKEKEVSALKDQQNAALTEAAVALKEFVEATGRIGQDATRQFRVQRPSEQSPPRR